MSDEIDDGGPAFPVKHLDSELHYPGLTIRDWFAGQVLASLERKERDCDFEGMDDIAKYCYIVADAMITERNK